MNNDLPPLPEPVHKASARYYPRDPLTGEAHDPGPMWSPAWSEGQMREYAQQAVMAERDRCAKLIEEADAYRGGHGYPPSLSARELAALIRALS